MPWLIVAFGCQTPSWKTSWRYHYQEGKFQFLFSTDQLHSSECDCLDYLLVIQKMRNVFFKRKLLNEK